MTDEITLGYELENGEQVNMHVGVHDWEGQAVLADDCLYTLHTMVDGEDAKTNIPVKEILNLRYIVQNMKENLNKLERKVDDLIDENSELQKRYDTLQNGFNVVTALNKTLGEKNKELFDYATDTKAKCEAYETVLIQAKAGKDDEEVGNNESGDGAINLS